MNTHKGWLSTVTAILLTGLLLGLALIHSGPAPQAIAQPKATAASELDLVPADAVSFAHVRLADIWKSELMAGLRATLEKAGPKAVAALEEQLVPPPSAFDRATVFVTFGQRGPEPIGIIAFTKPVDSEQLVKTYMPNAKTLKVANKTVYVCNECQMAAYFPSDRQVVLGEPTALESYLSKPVAAEGNMKAALALAATRSVVVAGNLAAIPIPPDVFRGLAPPLVDLARAQTVTLSIDLAGDPRVVLEAGYKDAASVAAAEKSIAALQKLGKEQTAKARAEMEGRLFDAKRKTPRPPQEYPEVLASVMGVGAMNRLDELIDNPGIKKVGNALTVEATIPKEIMAGAGAYSAVAIGFLLPAVQKVRDAAGRTQSMNNLKQIGLAIHSYHDATGHFPEDIKDKNGKPLLSWRVAILPYIEQAALYNLFKLDEPWDSPNNKRASQANIKTFLSPNVAINISEANGFGLTHYKGVAGPGTIFDPKGKIRLASVTDGLSNTIMVIETADAIPWAKPGDFEYDPKKPLPNFLLPGRDVFNALFGDGSVRTVSKAVPEKSLRAAFTRDGGEAESLDW